MKNLLLVFVGLVIGFAICLLFHFPKSSQTQSQSTSQPVIAPVGGLSFHKTPAVRVPPSLVKSFIINTVNNRKPDTALFLPDSLRAEGIMVSKSDLLNLIDTVTTGSGSDSIRILIAAVADSGKPEQEIVMQSGVDNIGGITTCLCMSPCCPWTKAPINEPLFRDKN